MSELDADRYLAGQYASAAGHAPLDLGHARDAVFLVDAFEAIGLVDVHEADAWRQRLERLSLEWSEQPLLPASIRGVARALRAEQDGERPIDDSWRRMEAQRALDAVGALSWRDRDPEDDPGLVVDRVIPAPAHGAGDITVSSIVLFTGAVRVHWYASSSLFEIAGDEPPLDRPSGPLELVLRDDVGTRYAFDEGGYASGAGRTVVGASGFRPAAPPAATWLEVARGDTRIVHVPLD